MNDTNDKKIGRGGESYAAVVTVDPVVGQPLARVYKNEKVEWNPPHEGEVISEEKRKEILQNVVDAMRFRKFNVEMV